MPTIKKQEVIDVIENVGLDYVILSDRLFRIKSKEHRPDDRYDAFVEICGDKIAYNSYIIGKLPDLEKELRLIIAPPKKSRKHKIEDNININEMSVVQSDSERT